MSDTTISPIEDIYRQEAVRRLIRPSESLLPWDDKVASELDDWLARVKHDLKADRAGFLCFPDSWMGPYPMLNSTRLLFGRAHTDPFRIDVFDCVLFLASNDEDFAQDKNKRGPSKKWSAEARRLLSQIRSCKRVNAADLQTMLAMANDHLEQIAGHVAKIRGANSQDVFEIIEQRAKQEEFARPKRLVEILDRTFDFRQVNYIWSTSDTIRFHAPDAVRQRPYVAFYHQLKESGQFPDFYSYRRGLVDPSGHRVINGEHEPYQALRYPADPIVAQGLIAIAEEQEETLGVISVVDVTTRLLARHVAGQPMVLGDTDPGLIAEYHTDAAPIDGGPTKP